MLVHILPPCTKDAPEVVPWYQVDQKVRLDLGYLARADREAGFYWDFDLLNWYTSHHPHPRAK